MSAPPHPHLLSLIDRVSKTDRFSCCAEIAGNILFPAGVKMLVGQFDQLFGTATGRQLQSLAIQNKWVLAWGLGAWNSSSWGGHWHHSAPSRNYSFAGRVLDPTVLAATTAGHNYTTSPATVAAWQVAWATAASARAANKTGIAWLHQWRELPQALHLEPLRAGDCGSVNACVGVSGGSCVCYSDR